MAGTLHVRRSCDFSSLTSSAAHRRASGIFPASRKARALARAWLSADRSAADSFPDRASRAVRVPDDAFALLLVQAVQLGLAGREISIGNASIAMSIGARQLGVSCLWIEAELADVKLSAIEKWRLRQRAGLVRQLLTGAPSLSRRDLGRDLPLGSRSFGLALLRTTKQRPTDWLAALPGSRAEWCRSGRTGRCLKSFALAGW